MAARVKSGVLLTSSARTVTTNADDQINKDYRGVMIVVDVTAVTSTPALTVKIQAKTASGVYATILASAAVATVSTNIYYVHPELTASANLVANAYLPDTWRVSVVAGDTDSATYTVDYTLLP